MASSKASEIPPAAPVPSSSIPGGSGVRSAARCCAMTHTGRRKRKDRKGGTTKAPPFRVCVCARRWRRRAQQSLIAIAGAQRGNVFDRIPWPVDQGHFLWWMVDAAPNEQQFKGRMPTNVGDWARGVALCLCRTRWTCDILVPFQQPWRLL